MTAIMVAERRVTELQEALLVAMRARTRLKTVMRDLASLDEAFDKACEAIYNATLFDPMGKKRA